MNAVNHNRRTNAAGVITAAGLILLFVYSFCISLINVIVNEIIDAFSLAGAAQGLMSSMMSVGTLVALLVTPLFQGRVSKIAMLVFAGALQAVALVTCGASGTFVFYCMSCALLGIGGSLVDSYANSSIVDVRREESPKYLGYLHGLFGVGSLVAPLVIYRLLLVTGWRGVHYALAAFGAAAVLAVFLLSRGVNRVEVAAATRERKLNKADLAEYLRNRRNVMLLAAAAFASATQSGILVWIVRYMTLRFDAAALGATAISIFWICATITRFCIVRIRVAPIKLFIWGSMICAALLAAGIASASPVVMCIMMGGMGLSSGHLIPMLFSECSVGYAGKTTFTTSVLMFVMGIVRIIVPLVMASVSARVSVVTCMMIPVAASIVSGVFGILTVQAESKSRVTE